MEDREFHMRKNDQTLKVIQLILSDLQSRQLKGHLHKSQSGNSQKNAIALKFVKLFGRVKEN